MINHSCFKCKRRFELDPVFVGFELSKLKKKNPTHYQAVCPACRGTNKVSVKAIQAELTDAADDIATMVAEYEENKAKTKAEQSQKKVAKKGQSKKKK